MIRFFFSLYMILTVSFVSRATLADELDNDRIVAVLEKAANDHSRMRERIVTWKGKVLVRDSTAIQKPAEKPLAESAIQQELDLFFKSGSNVILQQEMSGEFVLDAVTDKLYSSARNIGGVRYTCSQLDRQLVVSPDQLNEWVKSEIHTPEHSLTNNVNERVFSVKSGVPVGDSGAMIIHRNTRASGEGNIYSDVVDPRILFRVNPKSNWDDFLAMCLKMHTGGKKRITGHSEGNGYRLDWPMENGNSKIVIDLELVGDYLLATSYVIESKFERTEKSWKYDTHKELGFVFPVQLVHQIYDPPEVATLNREFLITESVFDEEVPDSIFGYGQFSVANGDQLYDHILGEYLTFFEGAAIPSSEYLDSIAVRPASKSLSMSYFLMGNVVLLLLIVGYFAIKFWSRRRNSPSGDLT